MLDIDQIKDNYEDVKSAIKNKHLEEVVNVDEFSRVNDRYIQMLQGVETHRALHNSLSDDISKIKNKADRDKLIEEATVLKAELKVLESELTSVKEERDMILKLIPNLVYEGVPVGEDESDNEVLRVCGDITEFSFKPRDHVELGERLGIIDTEKSSEVSGSRFNYLLGDAVLLQFALVQFVIRILTSEEVLSKIASGIDDIKTTPFIPVLPPVMVRQDVMEKMDRLDPCDDRYLLDKDNLVLAGSAEHTLGPLHIDSTLLDSDVPKRYLGYSTSFRREAGSYGKDTRGIFRVHQFDKLEMESFTSPENGLLEQDFLVAIQEYIVRKLGIPYQVVAICTGDMGKPDYRQIDIECWMPGQGKYRETHTSDYMTDYQSRRLNTRLENGEFAHMNDATALAMGRTIIAIMENYQLEDGTIMIPEVLQDYVGKKVIN